MTLPPPPPSCFRRPPLPPAAPHDSAAPAHCLPSSSSNPPLPISSAPSASKPASKPVLRRIANPSNRQLAFSKRRQGLLKKAHELSVLCDAQVAAIVVSSTGRVSEFSSPSMSEILKRYEDLSPATSNKPTLQDAQILLGMLDGVT